MKSGIFQCFAIISIAFAAIGAQEAAAQSAATPCSLLTPAQVSAAVGGSAGNGEPIGTKGCTWSWGRPKTTLSLWDASKWDQMKVPLRGMTQNAVSGLGDDAFATTMGTSQKYVVLDVKKGATVYLFKVYGVDSPSDQLAIEKKLAAAVLTALSSK